MRAPSTFWAGALVPDPPRQLPPIDDQRFHCWRVRGLGNVVSLSKGHMRVGGLKRIGWGSLQGDVEQQKRTDRGEIGALANAVTRGGGLPERDGEECPDRQLSSMIPVETTTVPSVVLPVIGTIDEPVRTSSGFLPN